MTSHTHKAPNSKTGGVERKHAPSRMEKNVFALLHLTLIGLCIWLVGFSGIEQLARLFEQSWQITHPARAWVLVCCAVLYFLRHSFTLFYLLARQVAWSEVFGLIAFIASFEIGFVLLGAVFASQEMAWAGVDAIALLLVLVGSLLNTGSEWQRKRWKQNPAHAGRCYTGGLFRYSLHINYFGDVVLFTGWALLTASLWALVVPVLMTSLFVFFHIPSLDEYLSERYGEEFECYSRRTKRLVPFVY